jgi:hypothetical protein
MSPGSSGSGTHAPVLLIDTSDTVVDMANFQQRPSRLSLWTAILTAVMAVASLAMAITTLPRSGPYCQSGCVGYPYTDAAAYVPRSYLWMYPAVAVTSLAVAHIHRSRERRLHVDQPGFPLYRNCDWSVCHRGSGALPAGSSLLAAD